VQYGLNEIVAEKACAAGDEQVLALHCAELVLEATANPFQVGAHHLLGVVWHFELSNDYGSGLAGAKPLIIIGQDSPDR
jgi:hypothetical protein